MAVCAVVLLCVTGQARAQNLINFSVDAAVGLPGTAVNPSGDLADIYSSPGDGTNAVAIPKALLGLQDGDNVDALSIWVSGTEMEVEPQNAYLAVCWLFSVDPAAVGIRGTRPDVYSEAQLNEAAGDVFWVIGRVNARNNQAIDEAAVGLLGPSTPEAR